MTKEEFLALDEQQKQEILSWAQETKKVEQTDESKTLNTESDNQKNGEDKDKEKSEETKVEAKSNDEQTEENGGEQKDKEKTVDKTDEKTAKPEYNAQEDFKKFGGHLEQLMEAQAKTLAELEKLAKNNEALQKELEEVKKRSPMGNYQPKPSDDIVAKEDKARDSFVERYKNAYKN